MENVFVTCGTGNVSSQIISNFLEKKKKNHNLLIGVRNISNARKKFGLEKKENGKNANCEEGIKFVEFDYEKEETYLNFEQMKISKIFLCRPPSIGTKTIIKFCKYLSMSHKELELIVYLSIEKVENLPKSPHYQIEQFIKSTKIGFTFLRCSYFFQNFKTAFGKEIKENSSIDIPMGQRCVNLIDVRDIGDAAFAILNELKLEKHKNKIYNLNTKETYNFFQISEIISKVLERKISYLNPSKLGFVWRSVLRKKSLFYTLILTQIHSFGRKPEKEDAKTLKELIGKECRSFKDYLIENKEIW